MKSTTDHIVYDSTDSEVRCRHCEDRSALADGATAELFVMRVRGFIMMHKLCQPKAVPDRQMAMPYDASGVPTLAHPAVLAMVAENKRLVEQKQSFDRFLAKHTLMDGPGIDEAADALEIDCDPPVNAAAAAHGHAMHQHAPSPDYSSGPDWYDAFCREWPVARDHEQLRAQVSLALQGVAVPSREVMASWHPDSGIFHGVANWARTALAYMNCRSRAGITPTLPQREEMPAPLVEARAPLLAALDKPAKKKRTRKAAPSVSIPER